MRQAFRCQPAVIQFEREEIEMISDRRAIERHHAVAAGGKPSERAPVHAKRSAREIGGGIEKLINANCRRDGEATKNSIRPLARPSYKIDRRLGVRSDREVHDRANGIFRTWCCEIEHRTGKNDDIMLNDRPHQVQSARDVDSMAFEPAGELGLWL
jgi:hypothetical protein